MVRNETMYFEPITSTCIVYINTLREWNMNNLMSRNAMSDFQILMASNRVTPVRQTESDYTASLFGTPLWNGWRNVRTGMVKIE